MSYERLRAILDSCEMSQYMPAFEEQAYDDSLLQDITNEVLLNDIGITIAGHRARILKALHPSKPSKATSKLQGFHPVPQRPKLAAAAPQTSGKALLIWHNASGRTVEFDLSAGKNTVGRYPENNICLEENSVSGNHAEITFLAGKYQLQDLGSTNGTKINGVAVTHMALNSGDLIHFGNSEVAFNIQAVVPQPQKKKIVVVKSSPVPVLTLVCAALLFGCGFYLRRMPQERQVAVAKTTPQPSYGEQPPSLQGEEPTQQSEPVAVASESPAAQAQTEAAPVTEQPSPQESPAPAAENTSSIAETTSAAPSEPSPSATPEPSAPPVAEPKTPQTVTTATPSISATTEVHQSAAPKGLVLSAFWDSASTSSSQAASDLPILLGKYATSECDLTPKEIGLYKDVKYLMPFTEALAKLRINRISSSKTKAPCAAFPNNSFYYYAVDGAFDDQFNRMLLVVDGADQIVAIQLMDDRPEKKSTEGDTKWRVYNFVQQKEKSKRSLLIQHDVNAADSCVVIETCLLETPPVQRKSSSSANAHSSGTPTERVRLYLPQPVANLILAKAGKNNS